MPLKPWISSVSVALTLLCNEEETALLETLASRQRVKGLVKAGRNCGMGIYMTETPILYWKFVGILRVL